MRLPDARRPLCRERTMRRRALRPGDDLHHGLRRLRGRRLFIRYELIADPQILREYEEDSDQHDDGQNDHGENQYEFAHVIASLLDAFFQAAMLAGALSSSL